MSEEDLLIDKPETETRDEKPEPLPDNTPIIVDDREPGEMLELLDMLEIPTKRMRLEDGDYIIGDWYITRKTYTDYLQSRNSGHLYDEVVRLVEQYQKVVLILEKNKRNKMADIKTIAGEQVIWSFRLPVIKTKNMESTAKKMVWMREKIIKRGLEYIRRPLIVVGKVHPVYALLATLPGVGLEKAKKIHTKFPIPMDLFKAVEDTSSYDKGRWPTKTAWKAHRWDAGIDGVSDIISDNIAMLILEGRLVDE